MEKGAAAVSDIGEKVVAITGKYIRRSKGPIETRTPVRCERAGGKLKFDTRRKAERCARELVPALGRSLPQRAYKCPWSRNLKKPHWHLTSDAAWTPVHEIIGGRRITVHCGPRATLPERISS